MVRQNQSAENFCEPAGGKNVEMASLEKALQIAVRAHENQKDRYGQPYILHPIRVMMSVDSAEEKVVAILHDVIEDSDLMLTDLRKEGFSPEIIAAVDAITKRDGEEYFRYIHRVGANQLARGVKLADLTDNMDLKRIDNLTEKDQKRLARYHKAWNMLKNRTI